MRTNNEAAAIEHSTHNATPLFNLEEMNRSTFLAALLVMMMTILTTSCSKDLELIQLQGTRWQRQATPEFGEVLVFESSTTVSVYSTDIAGNGQLRETIPYMMEYSDITFYQSNGIELYGVIDKDVMTFENNVTYSRTK